MQSQMKGPVFAIGLTNVKGILLQTAPQVDITVEIQNLGIGYLAQDKGRRQNSPQ